ncbi:MAG: hypothetical protein ACK2UW_06190 [Anaerolineales bacterium]
MKTNRPHFSLIRQSSAWLPLALSLAAMLLIASHVAVYGIVHQADEETAARIFQIMMLIQLPIGAYFLFKWLPKQPKEALLILALQAILWLAAVASVIILESL